MGGIDIRDVRRETLRKSIGIVAQDVFLYGGTIRDNIAYGDLDAGDEDIELVNPEVVEVSEETQTGLEGCLSLPGKYGIVTRPEHVVIRAQDRNGDWYEYEGDEILARCFLHEIDHLDGHMYTEIAEKMLTPEELAALEQQEADNEEDEG